MTHTSRCIAPRAALQTLLAPSGTQYLVTPPVTPAEPVNTYITAPRQFSLVCQSFGRAGDASSFPVLEITPYTKQKTFRVAIPGDGQPLRILLPYGAKQVLLLALDGIVDAAHPVAFWLEEPQSYDVECDD